MATISVLAGIHVFRDDSGAYHLAAVRGTIHWHFRLVHVFAEQQTPVLNLSFVHHLLTSTAAIVCHYSLEGFADVHQFLNKNSGVFSSAQSSVSVA